MVISLIGYRGSGKSSVAPLLASRLGWDWFDADALIEQTGGCTIREIFTNHGEPHFRELERQAAAAAAARAAAEGEHGGDHRGSTSHESHNSTSAYSSQNSTT